MDIPERCQRHEKALFGNGREGVVERVNKLEITVEHMNGHLDKLATSYAALAESQLEQDVTERLKIESAEKRYKAIRIVAIVFGIAIPLTALILKL